MELIRAQVVNDPQNTASPLYKYIDYPSPVFNKLFYLNTAEMADLTINHMRMESIADFFYDSNKTAWEKRMEKYTPYPLEKLKLYITNKFSV